MGLAGAARHREDSEGEKDENDEGEGDEQGEDERGIRVLPRWETGLPRLGHRRRAFSGKIRVYRATQTQTKKKKKPIDPELQVAARSETKLQQARRRPRATERELMSREL